MKALVLLFVVLCALVAFLIYDGLTIHPTVERVTPGGIAADRIVR